MMFLSSSWREVFDRSCADRGTRFLRLEFVVTGKQASLLTRAEALLLPYFSLALQNIWHRSA